ncbi:MAG TPA: hypothetical protein VF622_07305 [Segetibacter sp.]|jgi:hypothetical protein
MKKLFLPITVGITMLAFASCDSGTTSETTTDSLASSETAGTSGTSDEGSSASSAVDLNASYMDLSSGKTFTIDRDEATSAYVNRETRQPVLYYVNVATNDTFDRSGRMVNGSLIRMDDGTYTVDETRLKTKIDEDGDVKVKDGDDSKLKVDGNEAEAKLKTEGSKEKLDGNKYKKKTDTSKTKIRQ